MQWEFGPKGRSKIEAVRCTANQTKKGANNQKSAKLKNQEEREASTNLLALQEHIPTMWEQGQNTGPKTAAPRCRANQTERRRQLAKLASKEAGRTHLNLTGDSSKANKL